MTYYLFHIIVVKILAPANAMTPSMQQNLFQAL